MNINLLHYFLLQITDANKSLSAVALAQMSTRNQLAYLAQYSMNLATEGEFLLLKLQEEQILKKTMSGEAHRYTRQLIVADVSEYVCKLQKCKVTKSRTKLVTNNKTPLDD